MTCVKDCNIKRWQINEGTKGRRGDGGKGDEKDGNEYRKKC